jgi:flagellar protein FlbD
VKLIEVTRINDDPVIINAELIEMIEARPDTIITMTTGKKILVAESVSEVVRRVIEYRQIIRPIIRTNVPLDFTECTVVPDPESDVVEKRAGD